MIKKTTKKPKETTEIMKLETGHFSSYNPCLNPDQGICSKEIIKQKPEWGIESTFASYPFPFGEGVVAERVKK